MILAQVSGVAKPIWGDATRRGSAHRSWSWPTADNPHELPLQCSQRGHAFVVTEPGDGKPLDATSQDIAPKSDLARDQGSTPVATRHRLVRSDERKQPLHVGVQVIVRL